MPFTALQVTRNAKLTGNKELQRLQGPLGVGAQELKGATQLGRGLRSTAPPPTPAGQTPAGRGLASASKAAKAPAAKTPAPKTSATVTKGRAPASVAKAKQAAAQHGGKAGAGKAASKTKRRMLPKVRRLLGCESCISWPENACQNASGPCMSSRHLPLQVKHCGTTYEPGHAVYVVTDDSLVGRDLR